MTTKPNDATKPSEDLRSAACEAAEAISDLANAGGNVETVAMTLAYLVTVALDEQHAAGQGERPSSASPSEPAPVADRRADIQRWALCRHDMLQKDCPECAEPAQPATPLAPTPRRCP